MISATVTLSDARHERKGTHPDKVIAEYKDIAQCYQETAIAYLAAIKRWEGKSQ